MSSIKSFVLGIVWFIFTVTFFSIFLGIAITLLKYPVQTLIGMLGSYLILSIFGAFTPMRNNLKNTNSKNSDK